MNYPTIEQVNSASKYELARWIRFLPSPGSSYTHPEFFDDALFEKYFREELNILRIIMKSFDDMGGWDIELSRQVGWK